MYKKDILKGVQVSGLSEYTSNQLDNDLSGLVEWGNLSVQQEMSQPKTIEEYRNKHFRYQITTVGIEVEEFIQALPEEDESSGDLDSHMFKRFLESLKDIDSLSNQDLLDGWDDLQTRFDKIRRNATGYIAYLTSSKVEDLMQTTEFLVYKLKFIKYLREFVRNMQQTSVEIKVALNSVSQETIMNIVKLQETHDSNKLSFGQQDIKDVGKRVRDTWEFMCHWFIDTDVRESEYTNLINQTNEAMSRVTNIIQAITESNMEQHSRSKDYLKIAEWFQVLVDSDESEEKSFFKANKLSATLFGTSKTRHIQSSNMDITSQLDDIWKMTVPTTGLISKSRKNRPRVANQSFIIDSEKQEEVRKKKLEEHNKSQQLWKSYLNNGELVLSDNKFLPKKIRHELIRYFSVAIMTDNHRVSTQLGWIFEIEINSEKKVTIEFDDGYLTLPDAKFKIVERIS
ncbi:TIGR02677 family protein [Companilactobacillus muriivasis]|uniref:TIGR02677 family protein n=1 Tax=Companilactobacillus muriivasis TaxID=3081444 RepID=UPI0030C73B1B